MFALSNSQLSSQENVSLLNQCVLVAKLKIGEFYEMLCKLIVQVLFFFETAKTNTKNYLFTIWSVGQF